MKNGSMPESPQRERRRSGVRFDRENIENILDFFPGLACCCDDGVITLINHASASLLGVDSRHELVGRPFESLLAREYRSHELVRMIVNDPEPALAYLETPERKYVGVKLQSRWARELGPRTMVISAQDISHRKILSDDIHASERRFRSLVDTALDMICTVEQGVISYINQTGLRLMRNRNASDIVGRPVGALFHQDYRDLFFDPETLEELCRETGHFPAKLAPFQGPAVDVHVNLTREPGNRERLVLQIHDVSEHVRAVTALHRLNQGLESEVQSRIKDLTKEVRRRRKAEQNLLKMATHDGLTGLPNRRLLFERIEQAIERTKKGGGKVAIFFIDLDGFKAVNDAFGHERGDLVLKSVAERLTATIQKTDTVARFGGDEFVVVHGSIREKRQAETLAKRILKRLAKPPIVDEGENHRIGASIGVALYPEHGDTVTELIRLADQQMYQIKKTGKNNYRFFGHS